MNLIPKPQSTTIFDRSINRLSKLITPKPSPNPNPPEDKPPSKQPPLNTTSPKPTLPSTPPQS